MMKSIDSLHCQGASGRSREEMGAPLIHFDLLEDHIGKLSAAEAEAISDYMALFPSHVVWMSNSRDPLDIRKEIKEPDGYDDCYKWSGLTHYVVKTYRVDPPREFRDHVARRVASGLGLLEQAWRLRETPEGKALMRERWLDWTRRHGIGDDIEGIWALYP